MRIEEDTKLDFENVLIKPKRSTLTSRRDVDLSREYKFRHSSSEYKGTPVIASNMDGVGTFSVSKVLQEHDMLTAIRKHYTPDEWQNAIENGLSLSHVMVSTGTNAIFDSSAEDYQNMKTIVNRWPEIKFICIDVANGYQENFVDFVKRIRDENPEKIIVAGNVCTPEMTEELIISGADVVKVGIGPGSSCTTRIKAGVGYPQLSAIIECADAAHGLGGHTIGDGGCTSPGDIAKAFGAGADFVMLGGMLAFHEESEEEIVDGKIRFYGMSSNAAAQRHGARKDGYRSCEGKVIEHTCRGSVGASAMEIMGGLRSACVYVGARRLKDLSKCTTFVKVHKTHNTVYGDDWNRDS
jgi:GMP reductase